MKISGPCQDPFTFLDQRNVGSCHAFLGSASDCMCGALGGLSVVWEVGEEQLFLPLWDLQCSPQIPEGSLSVKQGLREYTTLPAGRLVFVKQR